MNFFRAELKKILDMTQYREDDIYWKLWLCEGK